MKKQFDDYKLLAGGGRMTTVWWERLLGRRSAHVSLYEGPDHLLYIESTGFFFAFKESYKRLDYSKIQAVSYGRTSRYWWTLGWSSLLLGLMVWGMIANRNEPSATLGFYAAFAGVMLLVLLVNLIKGPTCVCKVQTAVQVLALKPLNRLRPTRRAVGRLVELCQFHQGGSPVSSEALFTATATGVDLQATPGLIDPPFAGSKLLLYGLPMVALYAVLLMGNLFVNSFGVFMLAALLGVSALVLCVSGLSRSTRFVVPLTLKMSLWGLIANAAFGLVIALVMQGYMTTELFTHMKDGHFENQTEMKVLRWAANVNFENYKVVAWLIFSHGLLGFTLALIGLPTVMRPPGREQRVQSANSPLPQA